MENNIYKQLERSSLKKNARTSLKKHYLIFLIATLFAAFLGVEFADSLIITELDSSFFSSLESLTPSTFDSVFGTGKGTLSDFVSGVSSGTFLTSILDGITSMAGSGDGVIITLIILSLIVSFLFWFFITNVYMVISRRIFLEGRIYDRVSPQKFLFLFGIKKWTKASCTMFLTTLYRTLWTLVFIIGGVIKYYSYFLVPYIVAENPAISSKEAITLSRKMMDGHKFECFILQLSFIGWYILQMCTLGLSGVFYSNSYEVSTFTEFYTVLRSIAKEKGIPGSEYLNDTYLYEKASQENLDTTYSDIVDILNQPKIIVPKSKNFLETICNTFGISIHRDKLNELKELEIINESNTRGFTGILAGTQYPTRLFTIPETSKHTRTETLNYMKHYTISSLILMFFIFSFIGWVWEVSLHLIHDGVFVNRGTMHGPWLPIYGSGGILILTLLYHFRQRPIIQFFTTVVLCGIVEYTTSYVLQLIHNGEMWWDYSGYFLNIQGRVCAEGLLVFGLGGIAVVYLLAPIVDNHIQKINHKFIIVACCILLTLFTIDSIYSSYHPNTGKGISSGSTTEIHVALESDTTYLFSESNSSQMSKS